MKILKIFGVVVAVHAAVFMFVFAIPGCRTTSRSSSPPPAATAADTPPTVTFPGASNSSPVAASPADGTALNGADLNPGTTDGAPVVSFNGGGSQHFNPTRPGSSAADVLQSGDVTGVTPASTYKVVSNDSLWKIAKKHGIGVEDLAKANSLRPNSPLKVGQKLIIPGKPSAASNGAAGDTGGTRTYTVKGGESLGTIARKQGTTVATIRTLNPQVKNDVVRAGQELALPASAHGTSSSAAAAAAETAGPVAVTAPVNAPAGSIEYTVKPGEGLGQIAKKYGVPSREIAVANNIADPKSLRAGQKLIIPGVKTPASAPAITPPAVQTPVVPAPFTPSESPVAPAPAVESSPVAAPASDMPAPPVVKVDDSTPVAPANK